MNIYETVSRFRQNALNRRDEFGRRLNSIRADRMLSQAGKVELTAREHVDARADIRRDERGEETALRTRRAELERALFGWDENDAPVVLTARRDSSAFADAIDDPGDALAAYEKSKVRSDAMHMHALFARALESGWSAIVDDYLSEHPDRAVDAQELAAIRQQLDDHGRFMASMHYSFPKPSELAHVSLDEYERTAVAGRTDVLAAFARQLRTV